MVPDSDISGCYVLCALGQVTSPLWATVSTCFLPSKMAHSVHTAVMGMKGDDAGKAPTEGPATLGSGSTPADGGSDQHRPGPGLSLGERRRGHRRARPLLRSTCLHDRCQRDCQEGCAGARWMGRALSRRSPALRGEDGQGVWAPALGS